MSSNIQSTSTQSNTWKDILHVVRMMSQNTDEDASSIHMPHKTHALSMFVDVAVKSTYGIRHVEQFIASTHGEQESIQQQKQQTNSVLDQLLFSDLSSSPNIELLNDGGNAVLTFLSNNYTFSTRRDRTAVIPVVCYNCTSSVSIRVISVNGNAVASQDFAAVDQTITWLNGGSETKYLNLTLLANNNMNRRRTFTLSFQVVSSSQPTIVLQNVTSITLTPDIYCGYGVLVNATRNEYNCSGSVLSEALFQSLYGLPSGSNVTCNNVNEYFFVNSINSLLLNSTVIGLCNGTVNSSGYSNISTWCTYRSRCIQQSSCTLSKEQVSVCYCPYDYTGASCTTPVPSRCTVTMTSPTSCSKTSKPNNALSNDYEWDLDGTPPCYITSSLMDLQFSVRCNFLQNAFEGPHNRTNLTTAGYTWTSYNFSAAQAYQLYLPDLSWVRSAGSSSLFVWLKFFNFYRLTDSTQTFFKPLTENYLLGQPVSFVVNMDPILKYQVGGRIYFEAKLNTSSEDSVDLYPANIVLDVANYELPPPPPAALTDGIIALIVILCVATVGACVGGYIWKRRMENRSSNQLLLRDSEMRSSNAQTSALMMMTMNRNDDDNNNNSQVAYQSAGDMGHEAQGVRFTFAAVDNTIATDDDNNSHHKQQLLLERQQSSNGTTTVTTSSTRHDDSHSE